MPVTKVPAVPRAGSARESRDRSAAYTASLAAVVVTTCVTGVGGGVGVGAGIGARTKAAAPASSMFWIAGTFSETGAASALSALEAVTQG